MSPISEAPDAGPDGVEDADGRGWGRGPEGGKARDDLPAGAAGVEFVGRKSAVEAREIESVKFCRSC